MTATLRHSDDQRDHSSNDDAPLWAVHNPPRPGRDTLASHDERRSRKSKKLHKIHKTKKSTTTSSIKSSHAVETKDRANGSANDAPIAVETVNNRVEYHAVIDKVGHGVAPDPPVALPQAASSLTSSALLFAAADASDSASETDVHSATSQFDFRDSIALAVVGGVVLLVAAVVMVFARRQQRAYERRLAAQAPQNQETEEHEATKTQVLDLNGLRFDTSGIRTTRDDDEIGTPESVNEGVV